MIIDISTEIGRIHAQRASVPSRSLRTFYYIIICTIVSTNGIITITVTVTVTITIIIAASIIVGLSALSVASVPCGRCGFMLY